MASFGELKRDILDELEDLPSGRAVLRRAAIYPNLRGTVYFFQADARVIVVADVSNLPEQDPCGGVFGFHIHEGTGCGGDDFAETMGHYNPTGCIHPYHAGDLPPLFRTEKGGAWMAFLTDRFTLSEVIGKTVVIHGNPDDFMTQPAGNSGRKIACGIIQRNGR